MRGVDKGEFQWTEKVTERIAQRIHRKDQKVVNVEVAYGFSTLAVSVSARAGSRVPVEVPGNRLKADYPPKVVSVYQSSLNSPEVSL